ncbi:MAG TPA: hypothetical protein VFO68_02155 [Actinophytocola sp.]|nr:hypothetical protein [Actinophytocola sp.]HET9138139.1 hypothetical protein [Actinophytocola sp.]
MKRAEDFEGVLTFGIAVDPAGDPAPFWAYALSGSRLVIDVAHVGQSLWYCGEVFFGDQQKIVNNIDPPVTAVERRRARARAGVRGQSRDRVRRPAGQPVEGRARPAARTDRQRRGWKSLGAAVVRLCCRSDHPLSVKVGA